MNQQNSLEIPLVFDCMGSQLVGMLHKSRASDKSSSLGILIVVGGPQYRVGSHRQFVLLARSLADDGFPVMRFDYRGMGDSEGATRKFSAVDEDIKSAIDNFYQQCPDLSGVVIWGLCDAASAALFYAYQDNQIKGLVLLNPWVFTEQGAAKTYLKHYYRERLFSPDLWKKIATLKFDYHQSFKSLFSFLNKLIHSKLHTKEVNKEKGESILVDSNLPLPDRMRECLSRFKNPVQFILSGRDLTADEFREAVNSDKGWGELFSSRAIDVIEVPEADHTFSSEVLRNKVAEITLNFMQSIARPG